VLETRTAVIKSWHITSLGRQWFYHSHEHASDLGHKITAQKKKKDLSPENAQISTYNNYNNDDFTSVRQTVLICRRLSI